jgi:hypothetical protein
VTVTYVAAPPGPAAEPGTGGSDQAAAASAPAPDGPLFSGGRRLRLGLLVLTAPSVHLNFLPGIVSLKLASSRADSEWH